ncbi:MAG: DUF2953 domain-containing protein [Methanothrix sp.]|nr:DUF2953 domain-containing protein [Methanothrix sp.]
MSSCQISASVAQLLGSFRVVDYLGIFISLIILLLAVLLLSPVRLALDISKKGALMQGECRLAWLGLTLWRAEVSPQSVGEILESIGKRDEGEIEPPLEARCDEGQAQVGKEKDTRRDMGFSSLVNAAYCLVDIFIHILRSVILKKFSCCVCFGLDDPADTAVLCGYLYSIAGVLGLYPARISIDPWFKGEHLVGDFVAEIEIRPLWTVWAVLWSLRLLQTRLFIKEMLGWN